MKAAMATLAAVLIAGTSFAALAQAPAADAPVVPNAQTTQRSTTEPSHDMGQMKAPSRKTAQHKAVMSRRQIEAIQAALETSGQKVDKDGKMGPKTIAALRDFQKSHGLKVTGQVDRQTAQKLNLPRPI